MTILLCYKDISKYIWWWWWGGGLGDPYFFLHISSSWVKIRLHTENQLPGLPESALKVSVGWGGFHCIIWLHQLRWAVTINYDQQSIFIKKGENVE